MGAAIIGGIVAAAGAVGSAAIASSDKKKGLAAAGAANAATAKQLTAAQESMQSLLDSQSDPAEVFRKILLESPELLDKVLPKFRQQSIDTANQFSDANTSTFQRVLATLYPDAKRLQAGQVAMIDQLDPRNLGADEIAGVARKLSPFIPEGTLDPNKGSVKGGTTNPVSLYRNLVSGLYQDRRQQFLAASSAFTQNAENSAARQQERASSFLGTFLGLGYQSAGAITQATLGQQQQNLQMQQSYINALLGVPTAAYNSGVNDAAISQGVSGAASGIASAIAAYNKQNSTGASAYTVDGMQVRKATPVYDSATPNYLAALPS